MCWIHLAVEHCPLTLSQDGALSRSNESTALQLALVDYAAVAQDAAHARSVYQRYVVLVGTVIDFSSLLPKLLRPPLELYRRCIALEREQGAAAATHARALYNAAVDRYPDSQGIRLSACLGLRQAVVQSCGWILRCGKTAWATTMGPRLLCSGRRRHSSSRTCSLRTTMRFACRVERIVIWEVGACRIPSVLFFMSMRLNELRLITWFPLR